MERSNLQTSDFKSLSDPLSTFSPMNAEDPSSSKYALSREQLQKIKILSSELQQREQELASIQNELLTNDNCKEQYFNIKSQLDLANQRINYYENTIQYLEKENAELRLNNSKLALESKFSRGELENSFTYKKEMDIEFNTLNSSIKRLTDSHLVLRNRLEQAKEYKEDSQRLNFIRNLETENQTLRVQLQNALNSLAQCQAEIRNLPMLRHELKETTYLITEATKELEKEKIEKLEIMTKYQRLRDMCDNSDPLEYVHYLKMKYQSDVTFLQEKVLDIQKEQKDILESQELLKEIMGDLSYFLRGNFLYDELKLDIPSKLEYLRPVLEIFKEELSKLQIELRQRFEIQEHDRSSLASRLAKYQANTGQLQKKLEQVSLNIHNQEELYKQLVLQKKELEHELAQLTSGSSQLGQLNDDLRRDNLALKLEISKALSIINSILSDLTSEKYPEADLVSSLEILNKLYKPLDADSEVKRLRKELSLSEGSRHKDKELFNKCMQEMNVHISSLSKVIEENEHNSSEMLSKYNSSQQEILTLLNELTYLRQKLAEQDKHRIPDDAHKNFRLNIMSTQDEITHQIIEESATDPCLKPLEGDNLTGEVSELRDLLSQMKKDYKILNDNLQTSRELLVKKEQEIHNLQQTAHFTSPFRHAEDLVYSQETESFRVADSRESNPLKSSSSFIPLS